MRHLKAAESRHASFTPAVSSRRGSPDPTSQHQGAKYFFFLGHNRLQGWPKNLRIYVRWKHHPRPPHNTTPPSSHIRYQSPLRETQLALRIKQTLHL
ncbi:hypothetical protein E2C01_048406 [Portunus trituberculatus]|uniref:Uncharacterized protein n=1 Tax=Portunus trituberculatus TaxID=210409 RepID=A0A5B7GBI5_PORTR|nr:hypothetical protein [Portunus trituberculatus]